MSEDGAVAPIIIKRKKVIAGGGHHGGAWKVAYADFVTAMMAFFMLMWLLNATTEKQRKGLADYFSPTVAISRVSGGGDGSLGGDSVFAENTLPQTGTGATSLYATESDAAQGLDDEDKEDAEEEEFKQLEEFLLGRGGESMVADELLEHIVTKVTDEGLAIELVGTARNPLFDGTEPTPRLRELASALLVAADLVTNQIAIEGHTASFPLALARDPSWEVSGERAQMFRRLMEENGFRPERIQRTTAHADREPTTNNRMDARNDRLEIIFLRDE